jgi:hypothetical protein
VFSDGTPSLIGIVAVRAEQSPGKSDAAKRYGKRAEKFREWVREVRHDEALAKRLPGNAAA